MLYTGCVAEGDMSENTQPDCPRTLGRGGGGGRIEIGMEKEKIGGEVLRRTKG